MKLSEELSERGFVYQCSADSLSDVLDGEKRTVYLGIDPTADAIHVGHLVPYMLLNHLMRAGHNVILLMGGGTALIGDPSGKDTEREFVDARVVKERAKKMEKLVRKLSVSSRIKFVNNHDWLSKLSMIEFLRDVGKHFTVNAMMKKDSVSARLQSENGISYTEFSYALLQSYDFYHLHRTYGCDVQIGASDQWGNIISGIDYVRRVTGDEVYGFTLPLLINPATGKKFGKSEGNVIWLDPEKTSPYQFYQFWLNTSDEQVVSYLKLFTFLSLEEIALIEETFKTEPALRSAQKKLAYEMTAFIHGNKVAEAVAKASSILFEGGNREVSLEEKKILASCVPAYRAKEGALLVDVLVESGLASSKREARTFVEEGAVTVDGEKYSEAVAVLEGSRGTFLLVRRGKKQVSLIQIV